MWGSFSHELKSAVLDDLNLDRGLNLDTTEEQFLERVRRLAISHVSHMAEVTNVAKEAKVTSKSL